MTKLANLRLNILPSSDDSIVGSESMNSSVLKTQSRDANTLITLHDEIESKVLDEEVGIIFQRLKNQSEHQKKQI